HYGYRDDDDWAEEATNEAAFEAHRRVSVGNYAGSGSWIRPGSSPGWGYFFGWVSYRHKRQAIDLWGLAWRLGSVVHPRASNANLWKQACPLYFNLSSGVSARRTPIFPRWNAPDQLN